MTRGNTTKHDQIIERINEQQNKITDLMNFIYSFHTNIISNNSPQFENYDNENSIQSTFNKVKAELNNLVKLTYLEGDIIKEND